MSDEQARDIELIRHVLKTAESEVETIRAEADTSLRERRRALEQRLQRILREAEERAAAETEKLSARADAMIDLERSRSRLRLESRTYRLVNERVKDGLRQLRESADYGDILKGWIVEAALGLGANAATVACPADDRDTVKGVLDRAAAELRETHDFLVTLALDEEPPVTGQGVVLRNEPPTMAYSNTVEDRMRRFGPEIRSAVYRHVIHEGTEASHE